MSVDQKHIINRAGYLFGLLLLMMLGIAVRIVLIQINEGEKYKNISQHITQKVDTIFANKGNVYAADGSLLATSMFRYEIRMDVMTVDKKLFDKELPNLAKDLADLLEKDAAYYVKKLRNARLQKNRYLFIARNLSYPEYRKMRSFPIFNKGSNRGGFIAIQKTVREHPLGKVAARTIGYADYRGRPGIEGAFANDLKGKNGQRLKQKIAKGKWKPINDDNEIEPQDGKDIITTIDVNMQDIAHQALLEQLEKFEADHGSVVLMEVATGEIKAIANLGRTKDGNYYEKRNYAVYESHEPGSTFKLISMIVAMEDKLIDTITKVDTEEGIWVLHGEKITDSNHKGYGVISAAKVLEVSSNTGIAKLIYHAYKDNQKKFVEGLQRMNLNQKLGLPIKGEGTPYIPHPDDKSWSKISLAWMSHGYGVQMTPLQLLTFYNAIANNGEMVKPRFVKEIRYQNSDKNRTVFKKEIINKRICSQPTIEKAKEMLRNVVKRGTAKNIYSKDYSVAGKTGTCQAQYWTDSSYYVASFAGFFPVDKPKYSCIVVVHKPTKISIYGNKVAAPAFQKIEQKIYAATPNISKVKKSVASFSKLESNYKIYNSKVQHRYKSMPDVKGMAGMDAVSLLENLGLRVHFSGTGAVKSQSISAGKKIEKGLIIYLELS
jgi:cell division protein FtsI (penicillin-binding protein 3)